MQQTRREFLAGGIASGAASLLGELLPSQSWANQLKATNKNSSLANMFANIELKDQYGKNLDPAILANGPCLIVYGYGGCPMCQKITQTLVGLQNELISQKKPIPIVVISVTPEEDTKNIADYMQTYYQQGIKQFADEKPEDPQSAYKAGKAKPPESRIFHIALPPSANDSEQLQKAMKLPQNTKDNKQHSSFIVLFNNGEQHRFPDDRNNKTTNPGIRGVPTGNKTNAQLQQYGHDIAQKFINSAFEIPERTQIKKSSSSPRI